MKTKTYLVKWEIDIEATDPLEAAKQALSIQKYNTDATVFEIYQKKQHVATVDLYADTVELHKPKNYKK